MSRRLSLKESAALLVTSLSMAALMGLPGVMREEPLRGEILGRVSAPSGAAAADVRMALFDALDGRLLEVTTSDERGHFAFQTAPRLYHVFAEPAPASGLAGRWSLALARSGDVDLEVQLAQGRSLTIEVVDRRGDPVPGAEVRAYEAAFEGQVVARGTSDAAGRVTMLAPLRAHLGAFGPAALDLPGWYWDHGPEAGDSLRLTLQSGQRAQGKVLGPDERPLAGVVVSGWSSSVAWCGYAFTDERGAFALVHDSLTTLRALDPRAVHLPQEWPAPGPASIVLQRGSPQAVSCRTQAGIPLAARVFARVDETGCWGWGRLTDESGAARLAVADLHSILVDPRHALARPMAVAGRRAGPQPLYFEVAPAAP
jgi:hypothetical protein